MTSLRQIQKVSARIPARFVVIRDGREIGTLEKYKNTRTDTHPWKAFAPVGVNAQFLGAFYGSNAQLAAIGAVEGAA